MISINEIASAVYGTYRFARRDPGGLAYFDRSAEGAIRSFFAAVLLLPVHFALTVADKWDFLQIASIPHWFALEVTLYVIGWTLIPLIMVTVTRWIDRWDQFCDFIVAYNWSHILITAVWVPLQILRIAEIIPLQVFQLFGFGLLFAVLVYRWFLVKVSLNIDGGMAAALVAGEYFIGLGHFVAVETFIYGKYST